MDEKIIPNLINIFIFLISNTKIYIFINFLFVKFHNNYKYFIVYKNYNSFIYLIYQIK